jgi:UDP-N-acetyl-alpha-D-muramoyl-L-alanyl-L-glutamate epimerase
VTFIFDSYSFDATTGEAAFNYRFDDGRAFTETIKYEAIAGYNQAVLERALRLAFLVIGTSYVKTFPTRETQLPFPIDAWTATFLNTIYQEGLSQFAYENNLKREDLPHFVATADDSTTIEPVNGYEGRGILSLQSGGKDSLLTAILLKNANQTFTPWYVQSASRNHPQVLDTFDTPLVTVTRRIDLDALRHASDDGGRNGHVPVTYIVQSLALIQAILLNKNEVLVSIGHEGEEPHAFIDDLPVTHQWSKTWPAEENFAEYVHRYISPSLKIGSPLRRYTELRVAELFVDHAWQRYGHSFSSCNVANYRQGADNTQLSWCGNCPKCANSYLLFAPYVEANELKSLFGGRDLFASPTLQETFKGLLGIDGVMKPFECVGEIDELRFAYHQAQRRGGYAPVSFSVPVADFNPYHEYPSQQLSI